MTFAWFHLLKRGVLRMTVWRWLLATALCIGVGAVVYGASVAWDEQRRDYRDHRPWYK